MRRVVWAVVVLAALALATVFSFWLRAVNFHPFAPQSSAETLAQTTKGAMQGLVSLVGGEDALRQKAENGDASAQVMLGTISRLDSKNAAQAFFWFSRAADQGNAVAEYQLAKLYETGIGVQKDEAQALQWFRKAAEHGEARSRYELLKMYYDGKLMPEVDDQAGAWWRKLAEQVVAEVDAFSRIRSAAERGDGEAQLNLGLLYLTGVGTIRNRDEAASWLKRAAEQGRSGAHCLYGVLEASDHDWRTVSENSEAVEACRLAGTEGDPRAQRLLAVLYRTGRGVPKDADEAVAWTRKAADQGLPEAQYELGYVYSRGDGVPKDDTQALVWYKKAAEQGYFAAISHLALGTAEPGLAADSDEKRAERKRLSDLEIEHFADSRRELLPKLWGAHCCSSRH
jgi:uncharacterized protein